MRIATWNVNGLRARLDFVLHWLAARRPDVVGIQELKLADEQFPSDAFEAAGYRALVHGQRAWNGVAILSRKPAELLARGLAGQQELGARLVSGRVEGLAFATAYVPNGKEVGHPDFATKLAWLDGLCEWLEAERPDVLCGDFNLCPAPIDSWNEKALAGRIFHTEDERSRFRRMLDAGLVDLLRILRPDDQVFSWWDYRAGAFHKGHGLRIDFLLGTPAVRERVRSVEIDRDYRKKKEGLIASDHAPVIAELD